ncbi:ribonuclease HII [Acholeplasma granularum]|uniref:ribonuclease HII n=1 Tax=Acholeplasma granularum TaxID=264635 RepID=UPI0004727711|nr:ribonuclease HII [Acholeplasma granularum]
MITDNLVYEKKLWSEGYTFISGVDEAGRGPLAGPVVACAVILPTDFYHNEINDSKKISKNKREELKKIIETHALSIGYGIVSHETIDSINILEASRIAMEEAINNLKITPDISLTDYMRLDNHKHIAIKYGDRLSFTIASASILAKTKRDEIMAHYDEVYPNYGFIKHQGYGTKLHLEALEKFGPCKIHRKTFKPIQKYMSPNN